MKFMMNENISGTVIRTLRQHGHDVRSVKESMRAAPDEEVLRCAQVEQRVVVTHDKGFGELAFRFGLPATCGVILFRLSGADPGSDNRRVLEALEARENLEEQVRTDLKEQEAEAGSVLSSPFLEHPQLSWTHRRWLSSSVELTSRNGTCIPPSGILLP